MILEVDTDEGRYHRQTLITWWDQDRLRAARVLVVGAGALGNELVKDLALVGVGHLEVIDLDRVERSNLARCAFFREEDEGRPKAEVVARAAAALNPEITVVGHVGDVTAIGLGRLAGFDVVVGGLDNREARVWVNQACRKLGIPWVDGAIEGLRGVVRTFTGDGPCYECTLSEADREILARRRSCALLSAEEMELGKVPTTATTSSVVAAVQSQEVIRLLHGEPRLRNQGWTYVGETLDTWIVEYGEDPDCPAHDRYEQLDDVAVGAATALADLVAGATGPGERPVAVDLEGDLVLGARCAGCGWDQPLVRRAVDLVADDVRCPTCGEVGALDVAVSLAPDHPALGRTVAEVGLPDGEVLTVRFADRRAHLRLVRA
jgi:adenylyltransferase/sulfurtransferase